VFYLIYPKNFLPAVGHNVWGEWGWENYPPSPPKKESPNPFPPPPKERPRGNTFLEKRKPNGGTSRTNAYLLEKLKVFVFFNSCKKIFWFCFEFVLDTFFAIWGGGVFLETNKLFLKALK
jgi:hypothetical protein